MTSTVDNLAFVADIDRDTRRSRVRGVLGLDGIDFVEVLSNHQGTPGHVAGAPEQRTLLVHTLNQPVPEEWRGDRVAVIGGVRADPQVNPVSVVWAYPAAAVAGTSTTPATDPLDGVTPADRDLVRVALEDDESRQQAFVVRTSSSGDWSTYTLRLLGDGGEDAPAGFDLPLSSAPFTFTVDCPSDLDCGADAPCPPADMSSSALDYLARDYEALRTRLLDRLSTSLPEWSDRNPADVGVMLVELFAYLGDRLAYWQDAVAVEAYLGTARRRTSVRRHARLLNYAVHEGCAARVWFAFTTDTALTLAAGTPVADVRPPGSAGLAATPADAVEAGAVVFETCTPMAISPDRNALPLYSWGDRAHCLPAGATSAFVTGPVGTDPELASGDVLVLADQPVNGTPAHGDPGLRFAVRLDRDPVRHVDALDPTRPVWEIHWHAEDALPQPLQVSEPGTDDPRAVALANVALADHGATVTGEHLDPPTVPATGAYTPRLRRTDLTFAHPVVEAHVASSTAVLRPDPRQAVAQASLFDGERGWHPQPDLLASGRLSTDFVVEPESDGVSRLRFGNGVNGRRPATGSVPSATYRVGGGQRGNVAANRLTIPLRLPDGTAASGAGATVAVWNPLPAAGGVDPELLEQVRQLAPSAFRHQLRAVTSADYADVAMTNRGVQRAVARRRWTGSWFAQEVTVDPVASRADGSAVPSQVAERLEVRRMAGIDVALARPLYVPLHLVLSGCVAPGYVRADVERQVIDVLSSRALVDGRRGFFHPDAFTFGQPLFLSDVVAAVMTVQGLSWAELVTFSRMGSTARESAAALTAGRLDFAPREVLRCDTDPNNPEAGRVDIVLGGGS